MSNSLCLNFDDWFNEEYKQIIDENKIFQFINTKYPHPDKRVAYSIVMACLMYMASSRMIGADLLTPDD